MRSEWRADRQMYCIYRTQWTMFKLFTLWKEHWSEHYTTHNLNCVILFEWRWVLCCIWIEIKNDKIFKFIETNFDNSCDSGDVCVFLQQVSGRWHVFFFSFFVNRETSCSFASRLHIVLCLTQGDWKVCVEMKWSVRRCLTPLWGHDSNNVCCPPGYPGKRKGLVQTALT